MASTAVSPFPGMDPYLESPAHWDDFHSRFINALADAITDKLPADYFTSIGEHVSLLEPELPLKNIVPKNKTGDGRGAYLEKRYGLLDRPVNLVELDLLRGGKRIDLAKPLPIAHYYALVWRSDRRPDCEVSSWNLRDPLPTLTVPLRPPEDDVLVDLGEAFSTAYHRGRYDRRVDYSGPMPGPALTAPDAEWAAGLVRSGRR